jgi:hypothetical protein
LSAGGSSLQKKAAGKILAAKMRQNAIEAAERSTTKSIAVTIPRATAGNKV